jgi:ribosomal protein L24
MVLQVNDVVTVLNGRYRGLCGKVVKVMDVMCNVDLVMIEQVVRLYKSNLKIIRTAIQLREMNERAVSESEQVPNSDISEMRGKVAEMRNEMQALREDVHELKQLVMDLVRLKLRE